MGSIHRLSGINLTDENQRVIKLVFDAFPGSKILRIGKKMTWTKEQSYAISKAGEEAGAYLECIGKTDIMDMTPIEWRIMIETIITTYDGEQIPF